MEEKEQNQIQSEEDVLQSNDREDSEKETVIEVPEEETSEDLEEEVSECTSLEKELASIKEELQQSQDKYLRLMAEFDNYRKRMLKEKSELIINGGEGVIKQILPVLDDIDRAEESMSSSEETQGTKEGVRLIFEKLRTLLVQKGLKKIDPIGEDFNVDFQEAVAMVPGQPKELSGKVIDCIQAGYTLNDKVIRHAKVAVAE